MANNNQELKKYVIIVAGGKGTRMQMNIPKQFVKLDGKPVLMHTIQHFVDAIPNIEIILALPSDQIMFWKQLCVEYNYTIPVFVVEGGETRYQSVRNALAAVKKDGVVGIHDAARPLVTEKIITTAYKSAEMYGNAVPATPFSDSIRQIDSTRSIAVDRSKYCIVQTPQCFTTEIIKKAYQQEYRFTFTDDASVVESMGEKIHLIDGHPDNIKITNPRDLLIAEALLKNKPIVSPKNKLKPADDLNILNKNES